MPHAHPDALAGWHAYMAAPSAEALGALIAEDCVFVSPVVHTPQAGKAVTMAYLTAAAQVLGGPDFTYVGAWRAERSAVLEFTVTVDGIAINGVDMIDWNEAGQITRFKVMVRPLKAINLLHEKMRQMLMAG